MKKIAIAFLLLASLNFTACLTREIIGVEEHPTKPFKMLISVDTKDYVLMKTHTMTFWECDEKKLGIVCRKACDAGTDLACPAFTPGGSNLSK